MRIILFLVALLQGILRENLELRNLSIVLLQLFWFVKVIPLCSAPIHIVDKLPRAKRRRIAREFVYPQGCMDLLWQSRQTATTHV
jgi:hypothetical protein